MKLVRRTALVVLACSVPVACKPPASSDIKTLENFALNEDVRTNVCSAPEDQLAKLDPRKKVKSFIEVEDAALAKKLSAELILALSAVPDAAFKIFQARKGKILVTHNAARFCGFAGAVKFRGKTPVFRSCMVNIPIGEGKTTNTKGMEGLTLVTIPDAKAIRHGIVRTMGYMVADTLATDSGFAVLRAELTKAFLTDVASSTIFSLKDQEHLLGEGIDALVRKNLKAEKSNVLDGVKASDQAIRNFMNFVVGESFDSYYCRTGKGSFFEKKTADRIKKKSDAPIFAYLTDTRKVMEHFFPRSHRVFMLVEAHMRGFASKLPEADANGTMALRSETESSGFALAGQTVAERKAELEQMIRQHANETRQAHEQWQQKKATYDGSWTDVWGTKKSEMDTAAAVYRYTQNKEQALLRELRAVEAEEQKVGATAQTTNDTTFSKVDTKVETFDANAELKKGVQETAKRYGEVAGQGAGYAGEKLGGLISEDAAQIGRAAGEGIGDGVGGVLGSFGNIATDSIEGVQKKVEDTRQFANDLAVDPAGTLTQTVKEKINSVGETATNVVSTGGKILSGDTEALSQTLRNAPVLGNAYGTAENLVRAGNALYTGGPMDDIVKDQYNVAAKAVAEAGSEAFGNLTESVNPVAIAENKLADMQKKAVVGGMTKLQNELVLDIYTDPKVKNFGYMKNAVNLYNTAGTVAERTGQAIEALDEGGKALQENSNPNLGMELLQSSAPGHAYNPAPAQPTIQPAMNPFDQSVMASPSPTVNPAPVPQAAAPSPAPVAAPASSGVEGMGP